MLHLVSSVEPLDDFCLRVTFADGVIKLYDVTPWFEIVPAFLALRDTPFIRERYRRQRGMRNQLE